MPAPSEIEAEMNFLRWKLANSKGAEYKAALKRYMELKRAVEGQAQEEYQDYGGGGQQQAVESDWGGLNTW